MEKRRAAPVQNNLLNLVEEHEREIAEIYESFMERIENLEQENLKLKHENEKLKLQNERLKKQFETRDRLSANSELNAGRTQVHSEKPPLRSTRKKVSFSDPRPGTPRQSLQTNEDRQGLPPLKLRVSNGKRRHGRNLSNKLGCICRRSFSTPYQLKKHLRVKMRGSIRCDFENCNKKFVFPDKAERHKREVHRGHKPFVCSGCNTFFKSKESRNVHQKRSGCKTERIRNQTFESATETESEF